MLCAITLALFKLWKILNQFLHVLNRRKFGGGLFFLQVRLHVILNFLGNFPVVLEHNLLKKIVVMLTHHHLRFLQTSVKQLHSVVFDG